MPENFAGNKCSLVEVARSWVGTPFQWCAMEKGAGCDCAGLVVGCLHECGLTDWRPKNYQRNPDLQILLSPLNCFCHRVWHNPVLGTEAPVILRQGDILLFEIRVRRACVHHLAIATDYDRMVHAYESARKVVETELSRSWWKRLMSVYRWKC